MTTKEGGIGENMLPTLALMKKQRSHVLFVLGNCIEGRNTEFMNWYQGSYREFIKGSDQVLRMEHFEQHSVDITRGRYARLPFRYLGVYELSLDGAEEATALIESIHSKHAQTADAAPPATWLYYPASERVGRSPTSNPSMLTLAFANGVPGMEIEFREWYATRHIRHALNIPALVSGQCFERTLFQLPGATEACFATIAVYEQEGAAEDIIRSFASLPEGTLRFPMMDRALGRFAEWVYQPLR